MNRKNLLHVFVSLGLLGAVLSGGAAPLQRNDVVRDPMWWLHVDADALRQTALGQYLLAELEKPEAQKKFAAFQTVFNFDPRRALRGLTLYGVSPAEEDAVLLVYADFDANRLTTLAEGAKDHQSSAHRHHTIHNWIDENKPAKDGKKPRTYAAIYGNRVVIFGQKHSRVAEALDVMDRLIPGLAAEADFARGEGGAVFLQGAARKLELPANDPNAAVFRQSRGLALVMGEKQQRVEATLTLLADNEEVARHIELVGRGLIGLMKLQIDKPENQKLARALSVEQVNSTVRLRLDMPASEMIEMLRAAQARKKAATP
ncbi:MAG: hypothetical protein N3I86_01270 [Verrucomicrobiae bacterium]|nr:hypothetical protein [Verrucomicrobiae bacterium]